MVDMENNVNPLWKLMEKVENQQLYTDALNADKKVFRGIGQNTVAQKMAVFANKALVRQFREHQANKLL